VGHCTRLSGLSVADGQVSGQCAQRKRVVDFPAWLQGGVVPEARRRGVHQVALVRANGPTPAPKHLERWVQTPAQEQDWGLTFQVYWRPTHASWLDQVEIWFSVVHRQLLQPHHFTRTTDLEQALLAFIAYGNRRAQPIQGSYTVEKLEQKLGMN
jgi:deferrochelatase/peroxidase EfeB